MKNKSSNYLSIAIVVVVAIMLLLVYCYKRNHMPKVSFENLKDGAEIETPFNAEMKAENLVVEAATNGVTKGHGHFHIIIDSPPPPTGEAVPMDSLHLHYGKGQTNAMIDLPVGEHVLTLQFADGKHFPYDPQITQTVHVRVTKRNAPPVEVVSTQTTVETETVTKTKSIKTDPHTNNMHVVKKTKVKPDPVEETPPPVTPGYGGGVGGGGVGGGMGGGGSAP